MISQLYWLIPNHILYWKLAGHISSDELCTMVNFIATLAKTSATQKVHLVISCAGVQKLDYTNQEVRDAFNELATHKWLGNVTAIVSNYSIQANWNAVNGAFRSRWKNVTSLQAAIQMLKKSDSLIQNVSKLDKSSLITRIDQT